jgi:hypothetical protein
MYPQQMNPVAAATREATAPDADFNRLLSKSFTPRDLLMEDNFNKLWRLAEALANSALSVPKELKNNVGDCLAIVTQAFIWGLNPFSVAQAAHVINGKLGYEGKLINAVVMQSGMIRGSFHYEYQGSGQDLECRVGAVLAGESEITWGEWLRNGDIKTRNSPLWQTNPRQQLGYLQVKNWARAFTPGAILGIYSTDELADLEGQIAGLPPAPPAPPAGPRRRSEATPAPAPTDVTGGADPETGEIPPPPPSAPPPPAAAAAPAATSSGSVRPAISANQVAYLRAKLKAAGRDEAEAAAQFGVQRIEDLNLDAFDTLKSDLLGLS